MTRDNREREQRLRETARRQGYKLRKLRGDGPDDPAAGMWVIADGVELRRECRDIDEVERVLARESA